MEFSKIVLILLLSNCALTLNYTLATELLEATSDNYDLDFTEEVLAVASENAGLYLFMFHQNKFHFHESKNLGNFILSGTDITKDGRWVAVSAYKSDPNLQGKAIVYEYEDQRNTYVEVFSVEDNQTAIYSIAISDDHEFVYVGFGQNSEQLKIYRYHQSSYSLFQTIKLEGLVISIEPSSDKSILVVGLNGRSVEVFSYNQSAYTSFQTIAFPSQTDRKASTTSDGEYIVIIHNATNSAEVYQLNQSQYQLVVSDSALRFPGQLMYSARMNEDKNLLSISTFDGTYLYSYDGNQTEELFKFGLISYYSMFSRDSLMFLSGEIGTVAVYVEESLPPCDVEFCAQCVNQSCVKCHELTDYYLNEAGECQLCVLPNCVQCLNLSYCLNCDSSLNIIDPSSGICQICPIDHCLQCTNSTYCEVCQSNTFSIEGMCDACSVKNCQKCTTNASYCGECIADTFLIQGQCKECQLENCEKCTNLTYCEKCDPSKTIINENSGKCQACSLPNCDKCINITHCQRCDMQAHYYLEQNECTKCEKFISWVDIDRCCSLFDNNEECSDLWKSIIVIICLFILMVATTLFGHQCIKKWKHEQRKQKQRKRQALDIPDLYSEDCLTT